MLTETYKEGVYLLTDMYKEGVYLLTEMYREGVYLLTEIYKEGVYLLLVAVVVIVVEVVGLGMAMFAMNHLALSNVPVVLLYYPLVQNMVYVNFEILFQQTRLELNTGNTAHYKNNTLSLFLSLSY